jgi:excisionase family DNA binding protein
MKRVFTTGQVAKICRVSPRTVSKWFDSGRLQGYRIPGSQDRRIPRESVIQFLKENHMPLHGLEEGRESYGNDLWPGEEKSGPAGWEQAVSSGGVHSDPAARETLTLTQVAKICMVAPQTVMKWCDSGRLQWYCVPGSEDRCIPRQALIRFLAENGMPLNGLTVDED